MHCFVHQDVEAIGVCRACGKGLCPACATDLEYAVTCQGPCAQEARVQRQLTLRNRVLLYTQKQRLNRFWLPAFCIAMGAVFIFLGWQADTRADIGALVMGGGSIAFGLLRIFLQQRLLRALDRTR